MSTHTELTDDQIWEIAANCLDSVAGRLQFARAVIAADRAQLRAELDALRADAERYRWLRIHPEAICVTVPIHGDWIPAIADQLDAAIDAARKG